MKSKKTGRIRKNPINKNFSQDMNLIIKKLEEYPSLKNYLERNYSNSEVFY